MTVRIVVVSDCADVAFAEMRGAIYKSAGRGADLAIEPLVPVAPLSTLNAAFVTRLVVDAYPTASVVSVVVNSVSERTERIFGRLRDKDITFVGTNNGALGWIIDDFGCSAAFELHDPGFVPFGGKYVHAPAVGLLAAGADFNQLGKPFQIDDIRRVDRSGGRVVHVDNFGNAKFSYDTNSFEIGDRLSVRVGVTHIDAIYGKRMMNFPDGTWVVYPGSSLGLTELGCVRRGGFNYDVIGSPIAIERF